MKTKKIEGGYVGDQPKKRNKGGEDEKPKEEDVSGELSGYAYQISNTTGGSGAPGGLSVNRAHGALNGVFDEYYKNVMKERGEKEEKEKKEAEKNKDKEDKKND
ncbi:MAG: hypothetical protein US50_C0006G0009 [Candidatus Nomurabacteria bacterium GW2011_GWB1_37_5]|uniref:Uncharacterized protein n=1 Tax=Candidatus Nomurabacteria bacterium GW2011_GWB1_37_5 TaxID=1618742 RepID=A0A0G0K528_9BACT|nr:MAG: hypothetical protein US50_C0006G0009 [Candidatus Nomurabacteria bacterium GW2011_GWB1_37_5]